MAIVDLTWALLIDGFESFYWQKHNADLNMRYKQGNQTLTTAQEGQFNTQ